MGALEQVQTVSVSEDESWAVFSGMLGLDKRSPPRKHQHLSGFQEQSPRRRKGIILKDFFPQFLSLYQSSELPGCKTTESVVQDPSPSVTGHQAVCSIVASVTKLSGESAPQSPTAAFRW